MAGPIIAQLKGARIVLGGENLFSGVDVALSKDERIAFVGPNGAGKSTIMRILIGALEPDGGERTIAAGATIAFVPQEPDLAGFATLLDYCVAGFAADAPLAKHECEAQLTAWGLDPTRGTAGLSGGEIRRAAACPGPAENDERRIAAPIERGLHLSDALLQRNQLRRGGAEGLRQQRVLDGEARGSRGLQLLHRAAHVQRIAIAVVGVDDELPDGAAAEPF